MRSPDVEALPRQFGRIHLVQASPSSVIFHRGVVTGLRANAGDCAHVFRVFSCLAVFTLRFASLARKLARRTRYLLHRARTIDVEAGAGIQARARTSVGRVGPKLARSRLVGSNIWDVLPRPGGLTVGRALSLGEFTCLARRTIDGARF